MKEILQGAPGKKMHYQTLASRLAESEAFQAALPEMGEACDLKILALANIPLDFCNETDSFVRCPPVSSKKRKVEGSTTQEERMELTNEVFMTLG